MQFQAVMRIALLPSRQVINLTHNLMKIWINIFKFEGMFMYTFCCVTYMYAATWAHMFGAQWVYLHRFQCYRKLSSWQNLQWVDQTLQSCHLVWLPTLLFISVNKKQYFNCLLQLEITSRRMKVYLSVYLLKPTELRMSSLFSLIIWYEAHVYESNTSEVPASKETRWNILTNLYIYCLILVL